jgi:hypothetical protein
MVLLSPTNTSEGFIDLLEILLVNFSILLAAIVGVIVFLINRWKKKLSIKDKENQELKERAKKLTELCNQASGYIDMIASEVIKTEPSIVDLATWWSLNYHNLDINGSQETKEMIKRIISRKDI